MVYADDTTYRISSRLRQTNQRKLEEKILKIKEYLNVNDLIINMDKTKITECMIKQKRGRMTGTPPQLIVENAAGGMEIVKDSKFCRILGATLQSNVTWTGHLETAEKALLPEIRRNLGLLKSLGKSLPPSCRNTMARGMIISKLTYLVSVWGGTTANNIRKAQTLLNKTARWAANMPRKTKISTLLETLDWLTIREMTTTNSATIMWKLINQKKPLKITERLEIDETEKKIRINEPRLLFSEQNFTVRASREWNCIPDQIRMNMKLNSFKRQMKSWVKQKRTQEPD